MAISKKLEIIYHNGQPDGIRSIRRHLSTMTTYVIPRPLLSEAKKLTGINRPGIYYQSAKMTITRLLKYMWGKQEAVSADWRIIIALKISGIRQLCSWLTAKLSPWI